MQSCWQWNQYNKLNCTNQNKWNRIRWNIADCMLWTRMEWHRQHENEMKEEEGKAKIKAPWIWISFFEYSIVEPCWRNMGEQNMIGQDMIEQDMVEQDMVKQGMVEQGTVTVEQGVVKQGMVEGSVVEQFRWTQRGWMQCGLHQTIYASIQFIYPTIFKYHIYANDSCIYSKTYTCIHISIRKIGPQQGNNQLSKSKIFWNTNASMIPSTNVSITKLEWVLKHHLH